MAQVKIDLKKLAATMSTKGSRAGAKNFGNNATIWVDRQLGLICLRTPFSSQFVADFKALVPEADRDFSFDDKVWKFTTHYLEGVIEMTSRYFKVEMLPDVTIDNSAVSTDEAVLLKHVSKEGMTRVWRAVAADLHPDKGGDTAKFQEANEAYQRMMKKNGRQ